MFGGGPQAQGLLAAASQILQASGPSFRPTSLGQILGGGMQAGQEAAQLARARELQFRGAEADLANQERARVEQEQLAAAIRAGYRTPGQQAASLPGGPTADNADRIPQMTGGIDVDAVVASLMQSNPQAALAFKQKYGPAPVEYDTTPQVVNGPDGKPTILQLSKTGMPRVLNGFTPREKLEFRDGGNAVYGLDQFTGEQRAKLAKGVDPSTIYSGNITMRGQDKTDQRARDFNELTRQGQQSQLLNDPAQGPLLVDKGTGQARPVMMNGQAVPSANSAQKAAASNALLPLLDQAEKLIDGATGSYLGAGVDQAARFAGLSTDGAKNIAQLSVIEGNIMMAQPRMEGPQSNMDVALYRQMAALIGDPTVPAPTKRAALRVVRDMHSKYPSDQGAPASGSDGPKFLGFE